MSERITITCRKCGKKLIMDRDRYNNLNNDYTLKILVCEGCSHIILPKKYAGKKPNEI